MSYQESGSEKGKKRPKKSVTHGSVWLCADLEGRSLLYPQLCKIYIHICRKEGEEEEKGNEYSMCFHFGCVFCLWVVSMCVCVLCVSVYGVFCA